MKEADEIKKKLPGTFVRIISFIPVLNWIALIILGKKCVHGISIILGIIYGVLTFVIPDIAAYIWIIAMLQYAVTRRKIEKRYRADRELLNAEKRNELEVQPTGLLKKGVEREAEISKTDNKKSESLFSDIVVGGAEEEKLLIPPKSVRINNNTELILQKNADRFSLSEVREKDGLNEETDKDIFYYGHSSKSKFIKDMRRFAEKTGKQVPFVPFMTYWPTYDNMEQSQKAWYFYWRTEVRNENYIDTGLSYIFVYIYELLSGIGWNDAKAGYDKLMVLWMKYRERYPKLDHYLFTWTFDFAWQHDLEYIEPNLNDVQLPYQQAIKDILVDKHSEDRPLKLSFALVDSLCDYSLTGSKFYKDGHQLLMQEAIPRVISLVDASLLKKKNRGILSLYGPNRTRKQEYYLFQSAICPDANKKIDISVKAYTSSQKLRAYINEIVRFSENTLRAIYGCRGRLRGVTVEEETALLIEKFLKKEYSPLTTEEKGGSAGRVGIELNFNSIDELRSQSNAVRDALEVSESTEGPKELLTDLEEVKALLETLSADAKGLIDELAKNKWEGVNDSNKAKLIDEINMQAAKYLACALLVLEQDLIVVEDDYRDELDYIYTNQPGLEKSQGQMCESANGFFTVEKLSDGLRYVIENLSLSQIEILYAVLTKESVREKLEKAAEETLSMPEIIIDEINDIAMQYLDDVLIDTLDDEPCVLEQYEEELKQAMR